MAMSDLVSIVIGAKRLMIALVDSNKKSVRVIFNKEVEISNETTKSNIFGVLDKLHNFEGIGVAAGGVMNQNVGVIEYSTANKISNLNIAEILEKKYKVPVSLYNMSVASALGEKLFGTGMHYKNLIYVTFGTIIRGGIIANDRILFGKDGNAHEVGHINVSSEGGLKCTCGCTGHWIAYCSEFGIPQYIQLLLKTKYREKDSRLRNIKSMSAAKLYSMSKSDPVAKDIVNEDIGRLNAIGIANVINAYDPEIVILGGIATHKYPKEVLSPIFKHIDKYIVNRKPEIVVSKLKGAGKYLGAVSDFIDSESTITI